MTIAYHSAERAEIKDPILQVLFDLETTFQEDEYWAHYKGYNDLKATMLRMVAAAKELRTYADQCPHSETAELPTHAKQYIKEQLWAITRALG